MMFTLFEVYCSRPTILAVLAAMSRKIFNCPCLEHPPTRIRIVGTITTQVGPKVAGGLQVGNLAEVGPQIECELYPL